MCEMTKTQISCDIEKYRRIMNSIGTQKAPSRPTSNHQDCVTTMSFATTLLLVLVPGSDTTGSLSTVVTTRGTLRFHFDTGEMKQFLRLPQFF